MTFPQLWRVLWARRRMLIAMVAAALLLAAIANQFLPDTYVAEVALVVDSKSTDPVTGDPRPAQGLAAFLATQVDVIASHKVASKVVDRLKLYEHEAYRAQFIGIEDLATRRQRIAQQLLRALDVRPALESNVIDVRFSAREPALAAQIANAFSDAYIQTSLELTIDPARRRAAWFDEQVKDLRERLQSAQTALADYKRETRTVGTSEPLDIENTRLQEISTQLVAAQAAMYEAQTRRRQMVQAVESSRTTEMPDVVGSELLRTLKADIGKAEAKLANATENYGPNHPQHQMARAEIDSLRSRLERELQNLIGSLDQTATIAEERTERIQKALDQQEEHILALRAQLDKASVLSRDVESAQKAYDSALQRAGEVRLESQIDQTSIAVLNVAAVPTAASGPNRSMNLLLALMVGLLLAVGGAVALEMAAPRVRAAADLSGNLGLPVLCEIPSARSARALTGRSRFLTAR